MENPSPNKPVVSGVEFDEASFRRKLGSAIKLLLIFCSMYFFAALIATRDLKAIGGVEILGMPLALYTGMLVFVVGVVVTRMCLNLDRKD